MARAMVTQYGMSPLGTQVFGQPNHEVFLGRDYGNTQDYSEETARRIDDEVARIMREAHDRAHEILAAHRDQMNLMASVLLERETVEGEACQALLDNKWSEYLEREGDIIAQREAEEKAARERDAAAGRPQLEKRAGGAGRPGYPNAPYRTPAADADRSDMPTQAQVDAEIRREDLMDATPLAPDPAERRDDVGGPSAARGKHAGDPKDSSDR